MISLAGADVIVRVLAERFSASELPDDQPDPRLHDPRGRPLAERPE
jgi:hypothetical protein